MVFILNRSPSKSKSLEELKLVARSRLRSVCASSPTHAAMTSFCKSTYLNHRLRNIEGLSEKVLVDDARNTQCKNELKK